MKNKLLAIILAIILTLTGINLVQAYHYDGYGYDSEFYSRSTKFYDAEVFSRSDRLNGRVTFQNEVKFEHNFRYERDYPIYRNYDNYQNYRPYYSDSRSYSGDYYPIRSSGYNRNRNFFFDDLN